VGSNNETKRTSQFGNCRVGTLFAALPGRTLSTLAISSIDIIPPKDFRKTTYARAQRDATFRKALLTEAVNAYFGGEEAIGKAILKDFINATIGFEELASAVRIPSKSLHRMLGPHGNPSTANFFAILPFSKRE